MAAKYEKAVNEILARPEHRWYRKGFSSDVMKAIKEEQKERYRQ
jgi:hypothetical protein